MTNKKVYVHGVFGECQALTVKETNPMQRGGRGAADNEHEPNEAPTELQGGANS